MNEILNIWREDNSWAGLIISVIMHFLILLIVFLYMNILPFSSGGGEGYVEVASDDEISNGVMPNHAEQTNKQHPSHPADQSDQLMEKVSSKEKIKKEDKSYNPLTGNTKTSEKGRYLGFSPGIGDTTGLGPIYSEKSLNVSISYPPGWTFIDQNRHSKLDGVTFYAVNGIFNPPPYIFLEVKEKYLFNSSRFKYSAKIRNAEIFYNDPEEMENQVSQTFYFKTEGDDDFSIKLIMNGKDSFQAFQPVFFGMIKTFRFGRSLF